MTIHIRNAQIVGEAFWDLHAPHLEESDTLAEVAVLRRDARLSGVRHLTALAWQTAGGVGEPPEELTSAFALNFSAFATQALMIDFDQTPTQIGELTADILKVMLRRTVCEQSSKRDAATTSGATHS